MQIPNFTFVIFTFNEQARLPRVISNLRQYAPILIVDNYSTDRTVEIAQEAGCQVLLNKNTGWVEDELTASRVKSAATTDWLYWGYADEIVQEPLIDEIRRNVIEGNHDVIRIMRRNYFQGQFCGSIGASFQTRAFKKSAVDFRGNHIHEVGKITVPDSRVCDIRPDLFVHHLMGNTIASFVASSNRYTDLEMSVGVPQNRGVAYILLVPIKALWGDFFLRRGYRYGKAGLSLSVLLLIYALIKALKRYEAQSEISGEGIAALNDDLATNLLSGQTHAASEHLAEGRSPQDQQPPLRAAALSRSEISPAKERR